MDKALGPLPFVIGVTGHRDLRPEDIGPLRKAVSEILVEFRTRLPQTPLVVLSALADGADRLVAEVALAESVRLVVPLPMKQSEYEKDFDSSSLDHFRKVLSQVDEHEMFELPQVETSAEDDGRKRDIQYAQVGQYIALHSHLMIALWDGRDPHKFGGTADVVKMCLNEGRMEELPSGSAWLNYEDECGPVYQVLTPRCGTHSSTTPDMQQLVVGPGMVPAQKRMIHPRGTNERFAASWDSTERFNGDYLRRQASIEGARAASLSTFEATDPSELRLSPDLANVFVAADQLALHMKRTWEQSVVALQVIVVLALLSFAAAKNLGPLASANGAHWATWIWSAFLLCGAGAYGVWGFATWRQAQNRFLDYRGLAEALRVQFNWNVAGIRDIEVADCYLRYQTLSFTWIRKAVRVCCIGHVNASPTNEADRLRSVLDHWVRGQSTYFEKTTPKRDSRSRRLSLWALVWVLFAMNCTVLMWHDAVGALSLGNLSGAIKMLADVMFGIAAVIVGYAGILAVEDESRQYGRMRVIYGRADRLRARFLASPAEGATGVANARKVIRELGKEALEENGEWIVMHHAHPLNIPRWGTEISILHKAIIKKVESWGKNA
jgi:hypothetical protein